uniref:DNA helicase n=1 Tax=Macrostomum lignano TaxID=282301 RepID=A0A1I8JC05_9PLAT
MRTKQCAIRRVANSEEEDNTEATLVAPQLPEPLSQPQTPTLTTTIINGQGQQQLEDGTVVVQPEAVAETGNSQVACFDQASSGARCAAPGIYDTVKCTACGKKVNPYNGTMDVHPLLKVLVCQKCYKFYASGHFDSDEQGKENQCRWCGEGGSLICCDNCEHSFCRTCIKRNLGRSALQDIESLPDESVWLCYACDQSSLRHLQEEAVVVIKTVKEHFLEASKRSEKQKVAQAKKTVAAPAPPNSAPLQLQPLPLPQLQTIRQDQLPVLVAATPAIAYGSVRGGVGVTSNATIAGMQLDLSSGMMRQYSRFMQDLTAATTLADKSQIVSRFKSAYRMHLFLRLGKLRSLIAEEDKHAQRRSGKTRGSVIDLTGPSAATVSRPVHQPGLRIPQSRPAPPAQPIIHQSAGPVVSRHQQQQQQAQQRRSIQAQRQAPCPTPERPAAVPPDMVVVLSDDDDDEENNNNGGVRHDGAVESSDKEAQQQSEEAPASVAPPVTGGGKPAAILELLEARKRREKCARKLQQPRRIPAAEAESSAASAASPSIDSAADEVTTANGDTNSNEADAVQEDTSPPDPDQTASAVKRRIASADEAEAAMEDAAGIGDGDWSDSGPPSEKRPRNQLQEINTEPAHDVATASAAAGSSAA